MIDRLTRLEAAVHQELARDLIFQESVSREARNWDIGFDKAGYAYIPEDGAGQRVSLVGVIEGLSTPRAEQPLDPTLAG
jgi:hypothetical protein